VDPRRRARDRGADRALLRPDPAWTPEITITKLSAGALFDAAAAAGRAPGLTCARVTTRAVEPHKRAAIVARGLERSLDFVEVGRASTTNRWRPFAWIRPTVA
jgi:hypothetical protein